MIDNLRMILTPKRDDDGELLARCSGCRTLWPLSDLEDGLCPDCRRWTKKNRIDLSDSEPLGSGSYRAAELA